MDWIEVISTLGFPIVCCVALFWKVNDQDKQHKAEMTEMAKVIEANTTAITHLASAINKVKE